MPGFFQPRLICKMLDIESSKNVTQSIMKPTKAEIEASFSLSKRNNLNKWVLQAPDVTKHLFTPYGELDAAVAIRAQEGEGRDERRK